MRHHRQFSLATLMLGTTAVCVAFAVLPHPFVAYYVLLAFFFGSAVLCRIGPVDSRPFWRRFALSGWLYVILGLSLLEAIETTSVWRAIRTWLEQNNPSPYPWKPEHYLIFAHCIVALGVAITGAVLLPMFGQNVRSSDSSPTE